MSTPEQQLLNLLARIHRDGGHHTHEVGLEQSCWDADLVVATTYVRLDELRTALENCVLHHIGIDSWPGHSTCWECDLCDGNERDGHKPGCLLAEEFDTVIKEAFMRRSEWQRLRNLLQATAHKAVPGYGPCWCDNLELARQHSSRCHEFNSALGLQNPP